MTAPIRTEVYVLTEFPKDEGDMTMRDALQWFKKTVTELDGLALNQLETNYLNERWVFLVNSIAEQQGVPTGALSYFLGELAQAEIALKAVGDVEAEQAEVFTV